MGTMLMSKSLSNFCCESSAGNVGSFGDCPVHHIPLIQVSSPTFPSAFLFMRCWSWRQAPSPICHLGQFQGWMPRSCVASFKTQILSYTRRHPYMAGLKLQSARYNPMDVARVATMLQVQARLNPCFCLLDCKIFFVPQRYLLSTLTLTLKAPFLLDSSVLIHVSSASKHGLCVTVQNGQILGQPFQPHESHIPFLLQFKASLG